jgi:cytoskeletal protein RodZ
MTSSASSPTITVGRLLQEARSAKGLTIEAASAASKVSLSFVRLMEEEQFHLIPDPLYILRFLAEYSASLGLDPKQVETQFRRQVSSGRASAPPQAAAYRGSRIELRRLLVYVLTAVAVIPLIFIVLSLFSGRRPESPPGRQAQSPPPQEAPPQPSQGSEVRPPNPQASPSLNAAQPKGLNPPQPAVAPGVQQSQGQPFRYTLKATAKKTTWLALSVDGSARKEVLLRAGETSQWSAHKGFVVTIGNPEGIALSLNGKLVALKGDRGQVVRDLALPGDGEPVMPR